MMVTPTYSSRPSANQTEVGSFSSRLFSSKSKSPRRYRRSDHHSYHKLIFFPTIQRHHERPLLLLDFHLHHLPGGNGGALGNHGLESVVGLHTDVVGKQIDEEQFLQLLRRHARPARTLNGRAVRQRRLVRVVIRVVDGQQIWEVLR